MITNEYGKFETKYEKGFIYSGESLELFGKPSLTELRKLLKQNHPTIIISNASVKPFTSGFKLSENAIKKGKTNTKAIVLNNSGDILGMVDEHLKTILHLGEYL